MGEGSGVVTAVAWVTAVARVQALAWELLHVAGMVKKKKMFLFSIFPVPGTVLGLREAAIIRKSLLLWSSQFGGGGQPWAKDLSSSSFLICEVGIAMYLVHWIQWVRYRESTLRVPGA